MGSRVVWLTRHWTGLVNAFLLVFATLPLLSPLLRAGGAEGPSDAIIRAYSLVCHQMPERSYFLFGYPMAFCERDTAIYASMALTGLLWARFRRRIPRLHWSLFLLLILPMALDGFSQLAGVRESTWQLRTLSGGLFGMACVWFGYPLFDLSTRLIRLSLRAPRPVRRAATLAA